jgi:hypothetical protein
MLHKSMKGLGTDENSLIRIVVSRCEKDMVQIKDKFQELYNASLLSFIKVIYSLHLQIEFLMSNFSLIFYLMTNKKGDTSGDFLRALSALIGE